MSNEKPKTESIFNPKGESSQDSPSDNEKNKESNDQLAYDIQIPDLFLKKENESKLSIEVPDISNQKLKEYLNEDLLNAIDVSPMTTPKNIMINEINNEINENNENNEINIDHKDLFQFSLYNNDNNKNEENVDNEDKEEKEDEIKELNIIKLDEIKEIKEDKGGGNINIIKEEANDNNILNNEKEINDFININKENIFNIDNNNLNIEKKINNVINEDNNNNQEKINISEEDKKTKENIEKIENKENNTTAVKNNYYQNQYKYQYPFIQIPYMTQPLINSMNTFGHENKFDGNKRYQVFVPFTVLKKNIKPKKPFEIREGDWTCSNCNNLNFSFRVKCNRCHISKEQSELDKNKNNNIKVNKENKDQKFSQIKNKNYYSNNNANTIQYKYYPGFIYVPIQQQFPKK